MNPHYEIERKFIIRMPEFPLPVDEKVSEIRQIYLLGEYGSGERVRARDGVYWHTIKKKVSGFTCEESEEIISKAEFDELLLRRDPDRNEIQKTRHVFNYRDQVFEIDVYPFWKRQAVLEIELESEDTPIELPPFLSVIKEVTGDRAYLNTYIATRVPEELI